MVWTFLDVMRSGKATAVGAATAIVVGLVAITPAAGFISPMSAILLGAIAAVPSYLTLQVRAKTSLDDSLDVLAAHGVGGTVGALLTGVFAEKVAAVMAALVYSGVMSFVLLKAINLVVPIRAEKTDEMEGLDVTQHGEEAYIHDGGLTALGRGEAPAEAPGIPALTSA